MFLPNSLLAPLVARQDGATTASDAISTLAPSTTPVDSNSSVTPTTTDSVSQASPTTSSFISTSPSSSIATSTSDNSTVTTTSSTLSASDSVSLIKDFNSTSSATTSTDDSTFSTTSTTESDSSLTTSFSTTSTTIFSSDVTSSPAVTSTTDSPVEETSTEALPTPSQSPEPQNNGDNGSLPPSADSDPPSTSTISRDDPSSVNDPPASVDNPIETESIVNDSATPTDPDPSPGGSDDADSQGAPAPVSPNIGSAPPDGGTPSDTTVPASPILTPTVIPTLGPVANPGSDPQASQPTSTSNLKNVPAGTSSGLGSTSASPSGSLATALIPPTTSGNPTATPINVSQNSHSSLSGGAVAGIVIAVLFVISLVTFLCLVRVRRRLRAQRTSVPAAWYPSNSRSTPPVPPTPVREKGRKNTVLNAYGPGEHLPPVQPVAVLPEVDDLDPFWDPSEVLPPTVLAAKNLKKRAPGPAATVRKSGYGAGLLGERPMDPFADPTTVTAMDARLATDALSDEERASWVDQSGLFFTPSPGARMSQSSPRRVGGFGNGTAKAKAWNRLSDSSSAGHGDYREFAQPRVM